MGLTGAALFLKLAQAAAVALVTIGATWAGGKIFEVIDKEIAEQKAKNEIINNDTPKTETTEKEETGTTVKPPTTNTGGIQIQRPGGTIPGNSTTDGATDLPNVGEIVTPTNKENSMVESTTPQTKPNETPPTIGGTDGGNIRDETNTNMESPVKPFMSQEEWFKFIQDEQAKRWAREDAIRKEVQAREDDAYTRAVRDMQRAGINPNLFGSINPSESGGGITQASGMNFDGLMNQMKIDSDQIMQLIDQNWQGSENDKNRLINLLTGIFSVGIFTSTIKR